MENKLITNYLINKKIIMKKFCIYIVFLCFQQLCAEGHVSILQRVISSDGQDITNNFTSKNKGISVHQDCPMCYGTHGEKACAAEEAKKTGNLLPVVSEEKPRCHSEFFLLQNILSVQNINGCTIIFKNSAFPPCSMAYGMSYGNKTEFNPGIPCHQYLCWFTKQYNVTINVLIPKGLTTVVYRYLPGGEFEKP